MNWMKFFTSFFKDEDRQRQLTKILDAKGCREGWLQGAIFLHAPKGLLQTNEECQKYDLVSKTANMIAEIKICGGDYQRKMEDFILSDIDKLTNAPSKAAKFMILVIDTRDNDTSLRQWLLKFNASKNLRVKVKGENFIVKIWQLK